MYSNLLAGIRSITPEEYNYLEQVMSGMSQKQAEGFVMFYRGKRRSPQEILLFTLLGFIIIAGVQRFVIGRYAVVHDISFAIVIEKNGWIDAINLGQPYRIAPGSFGIFGCDDKISSLVY